MGSGLTGDGPIRAGLSTCTERDRWRDQPMGEALSMCTVNHEWVTRPNIVGLPTIVESFEESEPESIAEIVQSFVDHKQYVSRGSESTK